MSCGVCGLKLTGQYVTIGTDKMHAACFKCESCACELAGVPFMASGVQKSTGYLCQPCYVKSNCEICDFCKEPIVEGSMLTAGNKKYHEACYEKKQKGIGFTANPDHGKKEEAIICEKCGTAITGSKVIRIGGKPYHQTCFVCASCNVSLESKKFFDVDGEWMCQPCAESDQFETCVACGGPIKGGSYMVDDQGNKYHNKCYSDQQKSKAETCFRCKKLILKGTLIRDKNINGTPNGNVFHEECYKEHKREEEKAAADKIRAGGAAARVAPKAEAPKSLKEIEDGAIKDGATGLITHGGEVHTLHREKSATGAKVEHKGGSTGFNNRELPAEMERDLAKVGREKAAVRIAVDISTEADLVGKCIEGINFEKNKFCNAEMKGEQKERGRTSTVVIGKKTGTYRIVGTEIDVTWKTKRYTHRDYTGGRASKEERIRPLEHQKIPLSKA